jgi:hypothetical protein
MDTAWEIKEEIHINRCVLTIAKSQANMSLVKSRRCLGVQLIVDHGLLHECFAFAL